MNSSAAVLKAKSEKKPKISSDNLTPGTDRPTILIATVAPEMCHDLKELLEAFSFKTIWAKGVGAAKSMLAREKIVACLSGFWFQDGTYRELVRHIRRENLDIPVILVSEPDYPQEYRDYLAALNIGALDFLSHPYRKSDLEEMLGLVTAPGKLVVGEPPRSAPRPTPLVGPDLHPRAA